MPIYEFICPTCGGSFDKLVRNGRKAKETPVPCPTCGQDSYRKEVTLVAMVGSRGSSSLVSSAADCAPSG